MKGEFLRRWRRRKGCNYSNLFVYSSAALNIWTARVEEHAYKLPACLRKARRGDGGRVTRAQVKCENTLNFYCSCFLFSPFSPMQQFISTFFLISASRAENNRMGVNKRNVLLISFVLYRAVPKTQGKQRKTSGTGSRTGLLLLYLCFPVQK